MTKKPYKLLSHLLILSSCLLIEPVLLQAQTTDVPIVSSATQNSSPELQIGKTFKDEDGFVYKILNFDNGEASVQFGDGKRSLKSTLKEIHIPQKVSYQGVEFTVKEIASHVFTSLANEYDGSFSGPIATKVIIPKTVEKIQADAFKNTELIETVEFEEGSQLKDIGDRAFYFSNFSKFTLPNTVETIGKRAFDFNESLRTFDISPDSQLVSIGDEAFKSNVKLQKLFIPKGVTILGKNILAGNRQLKEVDVASENAHYTSLDGVLFTKNKDVLITYPSQKRGGTYYLPSEVKEIASYAFENVQGVEKIACNEGLVKLDDFALKNVENLKELVLPDSLDSVGRLAIYILPDLERLTIPKNVTSFGRNPLYHLPSLKELELANDLSALNDDIIGGQIDALGKVILKGNSHQLSKKLPVPESVVYEIDNLETSKHLLNLGIAQDKIIVRTIVGEADVTTTIEEATSTTTSEVTNVTTVEEPVTTTSEVTDVTTVEEPVTTTTSEVTNVTTVEEPVTTTSEVTDVTTVEEPVTTTSEVTDVTTVEEPVTTTSEATETTTIEEAASTTTSEVTDVTTVEEPVTTTATSEATETTTSEESNLTSTSETTEDSKNHIQNTDKKKILPQTGETSSYLLIGTGLTLLLATLYSIYRKEGKS